MNKFRGLLICTDLDGTLLRNDKSISKENLDAIEYFKAEGGYFTFVTGRMPHTSAKTCGIVKPNAPFGCINGGGLYDYDKKEYIFTSVLPEEGMELVKFIDETLPGVGFLVNTFYKTYFCKKNDAMESFRVRVGAPDLCGVYNEIDEPVAKVVFATDSEAEMVELERLLRSHPLADRFDFMRSEQTLFEILPKDTNKGNSIEGLCKYLAIDKSRTIAVGDYNNDVAMLKEAGVGIAVANACENAKAAADIITVSNEDHAIAQIINDIETGQITV